jgi:hypothetical protein
MDKAIKTAPLAAIRPLDKKKIVSANNIDDKRFAYLIKEIYAVMLDFTRIRSKNLIKVNPMQIGNVSFWFEKEVGTEKPQLKFSHSVKAWDEAAIVRDLDQYLHDLYYNAVKR